MASELTLKKLAQQSQLPAMDTGPIEAVLGDEMPELSPTPLGRLRLVNALRSKFGPGFRNHPSASKALSHFDSERSYFEKLRQARGISRG